jgi:mycothiol system anti-sigma-R factor
MMSRTDPACSDVRSRIWAYLDDELAADQAASVRGHLNACPDCRAVVAGERGFLERVARAGEEQAPAHLKSRVAAILDSAAEPAPERVIPIATRSTAWWPAVAVAAAAVVAIVLLALPRERPGDATPGLASAFLGDHAGHSLVLPSAQPFEPGGPEPPAPPRLAGVDLRGLSRCVVDGRAYAHYTYAVDGALVSVFVPLEAGAPLPPPGQVRLDGGAALALTAADGQPAAILVSEDLDPRALASLLSGA